MRSSTPTQPEKVGPSAPATTPLYPAEVHFSLIVTDDFTNDQTVAQILATRCVTRPIRQGAVSRTSKYRAFNVSVMVPSRDELDRLDCDLRGIKGVKLLL